MERKLTEDVVITNVDEAQGIVEAIWAVMGNIDDGNDIIHNGAFTKTFNERGNQIKLLDNHRTDSVMNALGTIKGLREVPSAELPPEIRQRHPDATGGASGQFQFLLDTPEGKGAFTRIQKGAVKGWSFGYDAVDKDHSTVNKDGEDITVRNLRSIKLYEISPVLFPMNEATGTISAKDKAEARGEFDMGSILSLGEKAKARPTENKAINLQQRVKDVRDAFYVQYPDIYNDDPRFHVVYWVKQIWDEFVIVNQEGTAGNRLWKIAYTVGEANVVQFDQPTDWIEVTIAFLPVGVTNMPPESAGKQNKNTGPSKPDPTPTPAEGAGPSEAEDTRLIDLINIELEEMEV
jgi:phage head maturation protease